MGILGHKTFAQLLECLAGQLRRILSSRSKGSDEVISGSFLPSLRGRQESGLIILILQMRKVGSLVTKSLASSQTASKGWGTQSKRPGPPTPRKVSHSVEDGLFLGSFTLER